MHESIKREYFIKKEIPFQTLLRALCMTKHFGMHKGHWQVGTLKWIMQKQWKVKIIYDQSRFMFYGF